MKWIDCERCRQHVKDTEAVKIGQTTWLCHGCKKAAVNGTAGAILKAEHTIGFMHNNCLDDQRKEAVRLAFLKMCDQVTALAVENGLRVSMELDVTGPDARMQVEKIFQINPRHYNFTGTHVIQGLPEPLPEKTHAELQCS